MTADLSSRDLDVACARAMGRPPTIDGMFLLGSNDARQGEVRIRAHDATRTTVGASINEVHFGGRVSETTEETEVALAMRRCGIRKEAKCRIQDAWLESKP